MRSSANKPQVKKLSLVDNWRKQFLTYSFWFIVLTAVLTVVNIALPFMGFLQPIMTEKAYGITMFVLSVAAGVSKFIKQPKLHRNRRRPPKEIPEERYDDNYEPRKSPEDC